MRVAESINLFFFVSLAALAWIRPLTNKRRRRVVEIGTAGIALATGAQFLDVLLPLPAVDVVRDWLPTVLIPLAYWQTGHFFQKPNVDFQEKLARLDERLLKFFFGRPIEQWRESWIGVYLELAYVFCYPFLPLGIGVLYASQMRGHSERYWMVVLPATYFCYALLPFVQTVPPRVLARQEGSGTNKVRALNLWVLRHTSIQVNTFPSAHVASSMAASFVLLELLPAAGIVFLATAVSIAAGAVLGRYHYAADAVLGAALAFFVYTSTLLFRGH